MQITHQRALVVNNVLSFQCCTHQPRSHNICFLETQCFLRPSSKVISPCLHIQRSEASGVPGGSSGTAAPAPFQSGSVCGIFLQHPRKKGREWKPLTEWIKGRNHTLCVIFVANLPSVPRNALSFLTHEAESPCQLTMQPGDRPRTVQVNFRVT